MRLRWYLVLAVLAALCPLLAFSAFVVYQNGLGYRTAAEQHLLETARAVALALDAHFDASVRSLRTLAASEHLDKGDLRAFYREGIRTGPAYEEWNSISLFDASGRRLLFSLKPFGTPLPPVPPQMVETFRRLVDTRRPAVSHIFLGPISKRLGFSVGLPVVRDGEVRYVLVAAVDGAVLLAHDAGRRSRGAEDLLERREQPLVLAPGVRGQVRAHHHAQRLERRHCLRQRRIAAPSQLGHRAAQVLQALHDGPVLIEQTVDRITHRSLLLF